MAAATTSVQRPANRKALYRRSNTLSSLPLDALHTATSSPGIDHRRPLQPIVDSPEREATAAEVTVREERTKSQFAKQSALSRQGRISDSKRAQFHRMTSCNDLLISSRTGSLRSRYPATATSGSVGGTSGRLLLSKMKERIRDTVLQTTSEWPAVMQERRQRAAIQFEMQAAKMMVDERRSAAAETTAAEAKSVTVAVDRKEAARAAFRRNRSASCEDAITSMLHPASAETVGIKFGRRERRGSPNSDSSGIICSSKDFQSIIELSRQEIARDVESPTCKSTSVSSPSPRTTTAPVIVNYGETPEKSKSEKHRHPTGDSISESMGVEELDVGCSQAAATTSVIETKPICIDSCTPTSFGTKQSDHIATTSLNDPGRSSADEVAADCQASSRPKPPEVVYDDEGQTWDIYGAQLDPEVLGDAIQRHLQCIMLTEQSVPEVSSQASSRKPSKDSKGDDDVPAATAAEKQEKSSDEYYTERQRNFIRRFLNAVTRKNRSATNQGLSN